MLPTLREALQPTTWSSVDIREEEDPADFPSAIIDLMVNASYTALESLAAFVD